MANKKGWFSKAVIVAVIVLNLWFTNRMISVHIETGHVPDSLIVAFFGFTTGEMWFLSTIKKKKEEYNGTDH